MPANRTINACVVVFLAGITARADVSVSPPTVGASGNSTASVLLARLNGVPRFSSGSASPSQRDLPGESDAAGSLPNRIYYSALTLGPVSNPSVVQTPSSDSLGNQTDGGTGVVTGSGVAGPDSTSIKKVVTDPTPSPESSVLALIGLLAIVLLRHRPGTSHRV